MFEAARARQQSHSRTSFGRWRAGEIGRFASRHAHCSGGAESRSRLDRTRGGSEMVIGSRFRDSVVRCGGVLAGGACRQTPPPDPERRREASGTRTGAVINDQTNGGGQTGFYWLPPIVTAAAPSRRWIKRGRQRPVRCRRPPLADSTIAAKASFTGSAITMVTGTSNASLPGVTGPFYGVNWAPDRGRLGPDLPGQRACADAARRWASRTSRWSQPRRRRGGRSDEVHAAGRRQHAGHRLSPGGQGYRRRHAERLAGQLRRHQERQPAGQRRGWSRRRVPVSERPQRDRVQHRVRAGRDLSVGRCTGGTNVANGSSCVTGNLCKPARRAPPGCVAAVEHDGVVLDRQPLQADRDVHEGHLRWRDEPTGSCTTGNPCKPARRVPRGVRWGFDRDGFVLDGQSLQGDRDVQRWCLRRGYQQGERHGVQRRQPLHPVGHLPERDVHGRQPGDLPRRPVSQRRDLQQDDGRLPITQDERHDLQRRERVHADRHLPGGRLHGREPGRVHRQRPVPRRGRRATRRRASARTRTRTNGTTCNDGNACTQTRHLPGGHLHRREPGRVHGAATSATSPGTCNPATGVCSNPNASERHGVQRRQRLHADATPARRGRAPGANPVVCTAQRSVPRRGRRATRRRASARTRTRPNGTACNDGNACTQTRHLPGGDLHGREPGRLHGAAISATSRARATPATGVCSNPNAPNGTACNDGNACTQTRHVPDRHLHRREPGRRARPAISATWRGRATRRTGICSNPNATNGTTCNDGNACTQTDTCQTGACTGGTPVACTASDQCHVAGTCNPATGCPAPEARTARRATTATPARSSTVQCRNLSGDPAIHVCYARHVSGGGDLQRRQGAPARHRRRKISSPGGSWMATASTRPAQGTIWTKEAPCARRAGSGSG